MSGTTNFNVIKSVCTNPAKREAVGDEMADTQFLSNLTCITAAGVAFWGLLTANHPILKPVAVIGGGIVALAFWQGSVVSGNMESIVRNAGEDESPFKTPEALSERVFKGALVADLLYRARHVRWLKSKV